MPAFAETRDPRRSARYSLAVVLTAGSGLSSKPDAVAAAQEACERALAGASRADAAFVLASRAFPARDVPAMLERAAETLGTQVFCGGSAHGVIAEGREVESDPAVAVLALSGIEAQSFLLTDLDPVRPHVADEIVARLDDAPREGDLVVLWPDPTDVPLLAVIDELRERLGPAVVVGAGAVDLAGSVPLQWSGREAVSGGLAGMVLRGSRSPIVGVTQACRPVTSTFTVTQKRGHWIEQLDGRPALDVYREAARGPLADDLRRAANFVLAAFPRDPAASLEPGSYLVRNVAGFALAEKAFAIPEAVKVGDSLGFVVRDPTTAREDLKAMLATLDPGDAKAGLYLNCCARGEGFFGVGGLEAAYLEQALGALPVTGMFGSCEIGPVGGTTELLTYTGVLALLGD